jgi:hypothetical protein
MFSRQVGGDEFSDRWRVVFVWYLQENGQTLPHIIVLIIFFKKAIIA